MHADTTAPAASEMASATALVADVGGTHVRFALVDPDATPPLLQAVLALPAASFDSLTAAMQHYLEPIGRGVRRAALAVAGPVAGDTVRLTNRDWSFSVAALKQRFGLQQLQILNDFGAIGWAVSALDRADLQTLFGPAGTAAADAPVSIIGPGTGLGVALLTGSAQRGWQVIETEGGHSDFVPRDAAEQQVADWIRSHLGEVSNEHVLSGPGLPRIAAALAGAATAHQTPAEVVRAGLAGEPWARRALEVFTGALGRFAAQVALLQGARRVVLAGGILPRLQAWLPQSPLVPTYAAVPDRSSRPAAPPLALIIHPQPGLLGAAIALQA